METIDNNKGLPAATSFEAMNRKRYYVLIEFVYKHLDFHLAELQAVLQMNSLKLNLRNNHPNPVCDNIESANNVVEVICLPNEHSDGTGSNGDNDHYDEKQHQPQDVHNSILEAISASSNVPNQSTTKRMISNSEQGQPIQHDDRYHQSIDDSDCRNSSVHNLVRKKNKGKSRRPFLVLSFPPDSPYVPKEFVTEHQKSTNPSAKKQAKLDIATIILSRCVLVRSVIELWGMGTTLETCAQCCKEYVSKNLHSVPSVGRTVYESNSKHDQSWKMTVHTLGTTFDRYEQDAMRSHYSFLEFPGKVQMINPSNEFIIIREIELDGLGSPLYPRYGTNKEVLKENDSRPPLAVYFGRALTCASHDNDDASSNITDAESRNKAKSIRQWKRLNGTGLEQYSLKQRKYLGPTSMDTELAFIMTNLGQVRRGYVVLDPFVGTGSILLSAAVHVKGRIFTVGTDIDIRVLRGRQCAMPNVEDENIISNFKQYNLPRPELIRSDNSMYHRHFRTDSLQPLYDVILCDPPYGIRAGARRSGTRRAVLTPVIDQDRHDHIAQTRPYCVSDVMADLLDVAARVLVVGGRLVYIIPSFRHNFDPQIDLPQHECLQLEHCCYQPLSIDLGRRMVVMRKVLNYDESKRTAYLSNVWVNGAESAEKCANIREKLQEAAKQKPNYNERKKIRSGKRKRMKQEKAQTTSTGYTRNSSDHEEATHNLPTS
jgi:tRNA (guanine10-N2)-methyltransferase